VNVVIFVGVSLDGFIARADGTVDFLEPDEPFDDDMGFSALLGRVDAMLMGRSTFDFVIDAVPADATGANWPYGETPIFVATHRPLDVPGPLRSLVTTVAGSPQDLLDELEAAGATSVYVDGGALAHQFLAAGLVDELTLTVVPRLIGEGVTLFGPIEADISFALQSTTSYPNGYVQLTYGRA